MCDDDRKRQQQRKQRHSLSTPVLPLNAMVNTVIFEPLTVGLGRNLLHNIFPKFHLPPSETHSTVGHVLHFPENNLTRPIIRYIRPKCHVAASQIGSSKSRAFRAWLRGRSLAWEGATRAGSGGGVYYRLLGVRVVTGG